MISAPAGQPAVAGKDGAKKDAPASAAIDAHLVYRASLTGLVPGEEFRYRVLQAGKPVFEASARARKSAGQPFRFVLFGDCGQGTPSENAVAYQAYLAKPDFVFIPGDIVYGSGRISEYRDGSTRLTMRTSQRNHRRAAACDPFPSLLRRAITIAI